MKLSYKITAVFLFLIGLTLLMAAITHGHTFALLQPAGFIADKERNLMLAASALLLLVVIPVFIMTFSIAWKYREGNIKAKYSPDWDHNIVAESIWWGIPCLIIFTLSVMTWYSTHQLDPAKPIGNDKQMVIQVVALPWKWLFIYPDQHIATVNYLQLPMNTPVDFQITADAPMNSFWIPQLGGQIYAMPGMTTQLHLVANQTGSFRGMSANFSGEGFSDMDFTVKSTSEADFNQWVQATQQSPISLTSDEYAKLAKPSDNNPPSYYTLGDSSLYNQTVMKFMMNMSPNQSATPTPTSDYMQAMNMSTQ